ncbi:MAG: hypothetical protein K2Q10_11140 [Rhodospirillales bacterium]|nr:hypothetical protein [Rhodospirillales bacterium]
MGRLIGIPAQTVDYWWPMVMPWIAAALARDPDYAPDDIRDRLLSRDMQLWLWLEADGTPTACAVTSLAMFPRRSICRVQYVGGRGLRRWLRPAQDTITAWARAQGCAMLEGYARPGWLRVLTGWRTAWTTIRRDL